MNIYGVRKLRYWRVFLSQLPFKDLKRLSLMGDFH